jgi:predicted RNA-binding protein Jag
MRSPAAGQTDASNAAEAWFSGLLQHMGVTGTVVGTGEEGRVHLAVAAERAGRLVGKRGATLGAIRHLLGLVLARAYGELLVDVDIADDRPVSERTSSRRDEPRHEPRETTENGEAGDRGGERGRYAPEKLQQLARRAAEKARETGKSITINLELNSYDRRLVHLEIAEIEGVRSQSEERKVNDASGREVVRKFVQVIPE